MTRWDDIGYVISFVGLLALTVFAWVCLSGCAVRAPRLEVVPTAERQRWEVEMSTRINDHERRLRELERRAAEEDAI